MKSLLFYICLVIFNLLFVLRCNNNRVSQRDTIHVVDTVYLSFETKTYNKYEFYDKTNLVDAYNAIKSLNFNKDFFVKMETQKNVYPNDFIIGMFYNEKIINEAVVLFYLKFYTAFLKKEKYCFKVLSNFGRNEYAAIFYVIFIKLSGHNPEKYMSPDTCYLWVLNQSEYLKNIDILNEIKKIEQIIK